MENAIPLVSEGNSHKQVIKSTAITGGSQVIVVFTGIVRTKVLAVLLGPIGVGIAGVYLVIVDLIKSIAGLGIGFSSVKSIAQAEATGDQSKISRVIQVLRKWVWFTAMLGAVAAIILAKPIGEYTFGNTEHTWNIRLLSIIILMLQLTAGQLAILQGLRKIKDMAKANVIGAIIGLALTIPVYYFFKMDGIVPGMIIISGIGLLVAIYYSSKIRLATVAINVKQTFTEGRDMIRLGFFTVIAGFGELATMYVVRGYIVQEDGVDAMGQFVAAWTISTTYLSVVLNAMGADYFPRISASVGDQGKTNKLVNEQMEIALLIICPLIIGMLTFISLVVNILYSNAFTETPLILYWQLMGDFFKVLTWSLMFLLLAKGKGLLYVLMNLGWSLLYLAGVLVGWNWKGLEITGIAFTGAYLITTLLLLILCGRCLMFRLSTRTMQYMLIFGILIAISYAAHIYLDETTGLITGCLILVSAMVFSYSQIRKLVDLKQIFRRTPK